MNRRRVLALIAQASVAFLAVVGCNQVTTTTPSPTSNAPAQPAILIVSAAASLQDVIKEIQSAYSQENPNTKITYNFAGSGSLQQQIEQGAPVDVFISAAQKQMDAVEKKNLLLPDTRRDIVRNEVVLVTSKNATGISDFKDLTSDKVNRASIGDPESVPAGQYGKEVLTSLNLFDPLKPKLVFAKDVRQVLAYVETGNVDAGIVYATDAKISDQVKIVATAPEDSHRPIVYPVAVLKNTKNPEAAKEFVQFLSSEQTKALFEKYGFIPVAQ